MLLMGLTRLTDLWGFEDLLDLCVLCGLGFRV